MPRMYCSHVAYCTTLDVQTLTTSRLPKRSWQSEVELNLIIFRRSPLVVSPEILVAKGGTMWARNCRWILPEMPDFHVAFRNLLHAVSLRHWTDGFTSPPKEGVLRIFFTLKNPTASAGFEPTNLGTKGQHATSRPPKSLPQCYVMLPRLFSRILFVPWL